MKGTAPNWLAWLEKRMRWLEIPGIGILLVTMQAAGFLMVTMEPAWLGRLALLPEAAIGGGEYWRLITWLALPLSMSPIWVIFTLWFLYFVTGLIEKEWGSFRTTLYVLWAVGATVTYSLVTGYPVTQASHFESTLFLAAAALFPNFMVQLFFVLPVKIKWLALLTACFLLLEFVRGTWWDRGYLLTMFSGYALFFGPAQVEAIRLSLRRAKYKRDVR